MDTKNGKKALDGLMRFLADVEHELKLAKKGKLKDLVSLYKVLYNGNESIKTFTTELNKIQERMRYTVLPEAMEDADESTITFDELNVRVSCVPWVRASIAQDKKEKAYAWLKKNELGALIKPTVNASTLSALAKDKIANGKDLPKSMFNVTEGEYVSMTRLKEKKHGKKESK